MRTMYSIKNRRGATLVELIVALFISTIVVAAVYQVYRFVTISTAREKQKAEIQRDIITVSSMLERDIRMAGCNLPGNGVTSLNENLDNDRLTLYINESQHETSLTDTARLYAWSIRIADTTGFRTSGSVCLAAAGVDTIYKRIARIGVNNSGPDTLHFMYRLQAGPFPPSTTRVIPTTRVAYRLSGTPVPKLSRVRNGVSSPVGGLLDSINIIPRNVAGISLGTACERAAVITVLVGGHVGKDGNRVFLGDSTQVNIRN